MITFSTPYRQPFEVISSLCGVFFLLFTLCSAPAWAGVIVPKHGGQVQKGEKHYYEVILHEIDPATHTHEVRLYVMNAAGVPLPSKEVFAKAELFSGGRTRIDLPANGENSFLGSGMFELFSGARMVVMVNWPGEGFPEKVNFASIRTTPAK